MRAPNASEFAIILGFILLGSGLWIVAPWISLTVTGAILIAYGIAAELLAIDMLRTIRHPKRKQGP